MMADVDMLCTVCTVVMALLCHWRLWSCIHAAGKAVDKRQTGCPPSAPATAYAPAALECGGCRRHWRQCAASPQPQPGPPPRCSCTAEGLDTSLYAWMDVELRDRTN
jgi:hypothetical protein